MKLKYLHECPYCGGQQYIRMYTVSCGQRDTIKYTDAGKVVITEPIFQTEICRCRICNHEFYVQNGEVSKKE